MFFYCSLRRKDIYKASYASPQTSLEKPLKVRYSFPIQVLKVGRKKWEETFLYVEMRQKFVALLASEEKLSALYTSVSRLHATKNTTQGNLSLCCVETRQKFATALAVAQKEGG